MSATINTIPASTIVSVTPSVIGAGGSALDLNGLALTTNTRVPIGTVPSFPSQPAVASYFGLSSQEAALATNYFLGFDNSNRKPGAMLFAQYPIADVGAYLRGGNISSLTLDQLKAISGSLTVSVDGSPATVSNLNLSSATSFSSASQIITTGLGLTGPTQASITAAFGSTFTGAGTSGTLTASSVTGVIHVGDTLSTSGSPTIVSQLTGTPGGAGTYHLSTTTAIAPGTSITATSTTIDVSVVASGTIAIGQEVVGSGVTAGTYITAFGTGTGGAGTYVTTTTQQIASEAMTLVLPPCTWDSISGAFVIASSTTGADSTITFASGTAAPALALTQATGAVISPGADAATPAGAMAGITALTQNWASFMTTFDPDAGSGNAEKLAFATWTNGTEDRFIYVAWDTDITPTESTDATGCLGHILSQGDFNGTELIYSPAQGATIAAFRMGCYASLDLNQTNGRATGAFRRQSGLIADVTSQTVSDNLLANGYNFYGVYATANEQFTFYYDGSISGDFEWSDSYVDQIWMNNAFQLAMMQLLITVYSIPYNNAGYALIEAAAQDPINQALNFGSIRAGVTLSAAQIAEVNNAAGANIAPTLSTRGWYFQVKDASPQVRQARGTPPITFWYTDGQSVQKMNIASVEVQ